MLRDALISLVVLGMCGSPVLADGNAAVKEADRLFQEGRALVDAGKVAEGCAMLAESFELDRTPGTQLNLGDCAEREGRWRVAWEHYDAAASAYERDGKAARAKFARGKADGAALKLGTLTIRLAEPQLAGLTVRVGDREVPAGRAEIVDRVDAGMVTVAVSAPGRAAFSTSVQAQAGETLVVDVPALALEAGKSDGSSNVGRRRRSRVRLALGLGIGGVVGLTVGGIVALSASRAYEKPFDDGRCRREDSGITCDNEEAAAELRQAGSQADVATVISVVGVLAMAAGAVVYFTAPREEVTVAPTASATSVGLSIGGRF